METSVLFKRVKIQRRDKDSLHGHLVDLGVVESFYVAKRGNIPVVEDFDRQRSMSLNAKRGDRCRQMPKSKESLLGSDKVDCDTLSSETSTTTDSVNVVLSGGRKIVVDDEGDLLNIDTTGEEIGGDEDTGRSRSELLHDNLTLTLVHISVHGCVNKVTLSEYTEQENLTKWELTGNGELASLKFLGEPVDL